MGSRFRGNDASLADDPSFPRRRESIPPLPRHSRAGGNLINIAPALTGRGSPYLLDPRLRGDDGRVNWGRDDGGVNWGGDDGGVNWGRNDALFEVIAVIPAQAGIHMPLPSQGPRLDGDGKAVPPTPVIPAQAGIQGHRRRGWHDEQKGPWRGARRGQSTRLCSLSPAKMGAPGDRAGTRPANSITRLAKKGSGEAFRAWAAPINVCAEHRVKDGDGRRRPPSNA